MYGAGGQYLSVEDNVEIHTMWKEHFVIGACWTSAFLFILTLLFPGNNMEMMGAGLLTINTHRSGGPLMDSGARNGFLTVTPPDSLLC